MTLDTGGSLTGGPIVAGDQLDDGTAAGPERSALAVPSSSWYAAATMARR